MTALNLDHLQAFGVLERMTHLIHNKPSLRIPALQKEIDKQLDTFCTENGYVDINSLYIDIEQAVVNCYNEVLLSYAYDKFVANDTYKAKAKDYSDYRNMFFNYVKRYYYSRMTQYAYIDEYKYITQHHQSNLYCVYNTWLTDNYTSNIEIPTVNINNGNTPVFDVTEVANAIKSVLPNISNIILKKEIQKQYLVFCNKHHIPCYDVFINTLISTTLNIK